MNWKSWRLRKPRVQYAQIGATTIRLASNSRWAEYRKSFHLYDRALPRIASVMRSKYQNLRVIDIGANVGDTAALIRESSDVPILCIEGDPILLPVLAENAAQFDNIFIEPSFVGLDGHAVNLESADDLGRNASLVSAVDTRGAVKLRSLEAILCDHPDFRGAKLLKTDTEGFDFDIIRQSIHFIEQARPAIFLEYDPHFHPDRPRAGLETLEALMRAGYSEFLYYDNFGNFLLHLSSENSRIFSDLDGYLVSNKRHGTAVYYFDICCLHNEDRELVREIKSTLAS